MGRFSAYFPRLVASLVVGGCFSMLLAPLMATNAMAAGMPQMEFDNPLVYAQFFWVLVIFFCLFLAVKFLSIPQIESVITTRRNQLDQDMESARQAKAQADKAVIALNKTRHEAALEAQSQIDSILQETRAESSKRMNDLQTRLDAEARDAEVRITEARNKALTEVDQMARDVAQALVKQLLREDVETSIINNAVNKVLATKS